ncbi:MAG: AAA family ATPase [Dethiobacteria bacterium]
MAKILICGRGGSGKSTLATMLAHHLAEKGKVLVVDADESNLGLGKMLDLSPPAQTLMDTLGGRKVVGEKLMAAIKSKGTEEVKIFSEDFGFSELPPESTIWAGEAGLIQIGKIEHSKEGCACPMGALAREFLNKLKNNEKEWVIVDTEAGVEHFGRGVLEGTDAVLMVIDPSHEAVILAEKAAKLAEEAGKSFAVVLNKVDEKTEPRLKKMLEKMNIDIAGVLPYSPAIAEANLAGEPLNVEPLRQELRNILNHI